MFEVLIKQHQVYKKQQWESLPRIPHKKCLKNKALQSHQQKDVKDQIEQDEWISKPVSETRGHTSYLIFASILIKE